MKYSRIFFVFVTLILLCSLSYAGQVSLSTYYPSPAGNYKNLRLVPQTEKTGACDDGSMYVGSDSTYYYCESSSWKKPFVWIQDGSYAYLVDTTATVGIGTLTPVSELEVKTTSGDNVALTLTANNGGLGIINFKDASVRWTIQADTNGDFDVLYSSGSVFNIDSSGNVTIEGGLTINGKMRWNDGVNGVADLMVTYYNGAYYPTYAP